MAYIGKEPIVGNFQKCDAISVVNGQAAYTLQVSSTNVVPESANHMLVSLNGILQAPVTSFTVSGSTLTFASNLATGDVIDFVILLGNVLDLGVPSDDTVGAAQIKADLISGTTALATAPADTDELLISDAGVLKRIDYSLLKSTPHKTLLLTSTISSDTTEIVVNNSYITSSYRDYFWTVSNMHNDSDGAILYLRYSTDNASSYLTSSYDVVITARDSGNNSHNDQSTSAAQIQLARPGAGNGTGEHMNMFGYIYNPLATDNYTTTYSRYAGVEADNGGAVDGHIVGFNNAVTAINTVKFYMSGGNIDSCVFKFYGIT
jgi:hypothetical protein